MPYTNNNANSTLWACFVIRCCCCCCVCMYMSVGVIYILFSNLHSVNSFFFAHPIFVQLTATITCVDRVTSSDGSTYELCDPNTAYRGVVKLGPLSPTVHAAEQEIRPLFLYVYLYTAPQKFMCSRLHIYI